MTENIKSEPKKPDRRSESVVTRTWFQRVFYVVLWYLSRIASVLVFELRSEGAHHYPAKGGGLVLSTHQSNLDPVLVGLVCPRRFNFLARSTLFHNRLFAWLIRTLDAIEIDREGGGLAGLRETLLRLKRGELVLIFPEGTRSRDGSIGKLKTGFIAVARRSKVPLIPVAIVGAYDCLPRGSQWPRRRPIAVVVGEPIPYAWIEASSDDVIMEALKVRLEELDRRGRILVPLHCSGGSDANPDDETPSEVA